MLPRRDMGCGLPLTGITVTIATIAQNVAEKRCTWSTDGLEMEFTLFAQTAEQRWTEVLSMELNLYDQCEVVEGCTVEILTNTLTGETSVGWWRSGVEDRPGMDGGAHD